MKKNTKDILEALSSGPVQKFILENQHSDIRNLVLKSKALFNIRAANLSEQIGARRKAKEKLPLYFDTVGIVYPPAENLEQCSSQATALYKSQLIARLVPDTSSAIGADLTGGFGVDSFFFSKTIHCLHYVEPQSFLLELARHNHQLLNADNIAYHHTTAADFLRSSSIHFDFIFTDPSRRPTNGKKVHVLTDARPDVLELQQEIFTKTTWLLVKASPLLDIHAGIAQLRSVKEVYVISVNNECKEVLFLCEKDFGGEPIIVAVNLSDNHGTQTFHFTFSEERDQNVSFGDPSTFIYEPNASILKAGAFKTVGSRFNLKKIAANTHLYSGPSFIASFPGRKFEMERFVKSDPNELKQFFPEGKANVTTRNYPLSAAALKNKTRLKDGGEKYLLGFSGTQKKYLVVAKRL